MDDAPLSRPEITLAVTRGAARVLASLGYAAILEVTLPNSRRADLMAISRKGDILIAEVKSSLEDYRVDRKWQDYIPYCDQFIFAVGQDFPQHVLPPEPGLMVCDGFGGAMIREAPRQALAGARRKALTIGFARLAALRSAGIATALLEA